MRQDGLARALAVGPSPGALIGGKYRILRMIGRGGMGQVLSATNEATGKNVALKWILDGASISASARFAREARAAGRIDHPNVVDVYDVIEHEGAACIVMELLRGESLAAAIGREQRFPIDEAVSIAIEISRGIAAAHEAGVIHRDLKPGNVFLCDVPGGPRVKVLDFGISKLVETTDAEPLTDTGVVLGTPQYLAPEQIRGTTGLDHRVDIYAIGAVLYEMLSGRPPHLHAHVPALLVEIATVAPQPVHLLRSDVPHELSEIVMRAIAKDPAARFPSATSLIAALDGSEPDAPSAQKLVRGTSTLDVETIEVGAAAAPISAPTAPTVGAIPSPARSGRAPFVMMAVLVAIGIAALATVMSQDGPPVTETRVTPRAPDVDPAPTSPPATTIADTPPLPRPPPSSAVPPQRPPASTLRASRRPAPVIVADQAVVTPPPTSALEPPHEIPTTPAPRAGRIGLDDL